MNVIILIWFGIFKSQLYPFVGKNRLGTVGEAMSSSTSAVEYWEVVNVCSSVVCF